MTKVHLITFEKKFNLKHAYKLKNSLANYQINWVILKYNKSIFLKFIDFLKMTFLTIYLIKKFHLNIIHCRSYFPTISVFFLSFIFKFKYIFDIRDFWADEGIEIKNFKFIYKIIKYLEGKLIKKSSHIVCLTQKAKIYIINKYKKKYNLSKNNISVIPCGTDFDLFNPNNLKKNYLNNIKRKLKFKNKKILLYYGSVGENYLINKMIYFFKSINNYRNDWIFFFVVNNDKNLLKNILLKKGISEKNFRIINSPRNKLPYYLSFADLSIFYYREGMRSLGCSPTKLADLFAMGIPIITSRYLGDMDKIIKFEKNKSLLIDNMSKSLINMKVNKITNYNQKINIRQNSNYFNYEYGLKKYISIYESLI